MHSRKDQMRRKGHLAHLMTALRSIAKNRKLDNPDRAAQVVKNRLIKSIEFHRADVFANWHYFLSIEEAMRKAGKPIDWVCCLVRYATNKQTKGRLRGSNSLTWRECMEEAAKIKAADQLTPVERRAVEIIRDARPKSRKNQIERRAIRLAEAVQSEWFPKQAKVQKQTRKLTKESFKLNPDGLPIFDTDRIPLTIADVISVAGPVIQEFAEQKIAMGQPRSNGDYTASFDALYRIVRAYSSEQPTREAVNRELNRVRRHLKAHRFAR